MIIAALVIVVLALVALKLRPSGDQGTRVVRAAPVAFNLRYPAPLKELTPGAGEWLHLERRVDGRLVDSMVVSPLRLPAYQGDLGGVLPVLASRAVDTLRTRFPGLELVDEGKARINQAAGYTLVFRVSRSPRVYGRLVLLPQPVPGTRDGVTLLLLATPDAGVGKADDVGVRGLLKTPYRTFRFGTQGP